MKVRSNNKQKLLDELINNISSINDIEAKIYEYVNRLDEINNKIMDVEHYIEENEKTSLIIEAKESERVEDKIGYDVHIAMEGNQGEIYELLVDVAAQAFGNLVGTAHKDAMDNEIWIKHSFKSIIDKKEKGGE